MAGHSQNLIKNPSFEDTTVAIFWTTSMGIYYNSPVNICSKTISKKGIEKMDFDSYNSNNCVYLSLFQCKTGWSDYLIYENIKLEKGKKYEISFYITPSDSCGYYTKEVDIVFCSSTILSKCVSHSTPGKIFLPPSLSFDISAFRHTGQEGNWIKLSGTFIASGEENTMIVGSLFKNKKTRQNISTRILDFKPTKKFLKENFCSADYYFDNFSLIEK